MLSITFLCIIAAANAFTFSGRPMTKSRLSMQGDGLKIDMKGKIVFVGGVADATGYGWAIAKACAEAGAKVLFFQDQTKSSCLLMDVLFLGASGHLAASFANFPNGVCFYNIKLTLHLHPVTNNNSLIIKV